MKNFKYILLVLLISIFSFWRMLKPGIYSMQDFHLFRLYEFDKCVQRLELPCRWAPDAGLGYGEPLFNFYGQLPYALGDIFYKSGFSLIDSIKILFIISLAGSGVSMFFLSKEFWKNNTSALVSSILYMYAPYRAVNVWVRGALPESLAFVLFPLIILSVQKRNLFYFSLLTSLLVITHNLSFVMLLPFLLVWMIYKRWWKGFYGFVLTFLLTAFYTLPVIFESKYINLGSTTSGYYDFRAHFITLKQIFIDQTWGYGGSTWGNVDGLNLSVGIIQWVIPLIILITVLIMRKIKTCGDVMVLILSSVVYLLLTHNKTAFIWETLTFMKYIQFPWRFLGMAVFCFSLSSGYLPVLIKNKLLQVVILVMILLSVYKENYRFSPDIWYSVDDNYFLTGQEWVRQRTASIGDFWPQFGHKIPDEPSDGKYINYFPGWESLKPLENGLIIAEGSQFKNTPIRNIANVISLIGVLFITIWKRKLS